MKKLSLFTGLISICLFNAQTKFEKGYFINNTGEKSEVLIKNLDWKSNPTEFEYKLDDSSQSIKENINNVQEFAFNDGNKYIRKTVMIDQSSLRTNTLSEYRAPSFIEGTVFLKYIIEGKASLLYYEKGDNGKFFYTSDQSAPKQLIYKTYYVDQNKIGYNRDYKKQISEYLNCGIDSNLISNIKYTEKDLIKVFGLYNACSNSETVNYEKKKIKKDLFNLNIRPGINFTSLETNYMRNYEQVNTKFSTKESFRIGLEFEFILNFNNNKWAIFTEPTFQYYKNELESTIYPLTFSPYQSKRTIDYKSIEIPLGVRHYFFLNNQSKIFVNAAYVFDFNLNSTFTQTNQNFRIKPAGNFAFGAGYKYNDKFSAEFRIGTAKNIFQQHNDIKSDYQTTSIILGYTLF